MVRALVEWQHLKPACRHAWTDIHDMPKLKPEGMVHNIHPAGTSMSFFFFCGTLRSKHTGLYCTSLNSWLTKHARRALTFEARPGSLRGMITMPAARMHASRGRKVALCKQSWTEETAMM